MTQNTNTESRSFAEHLPPNFELPADDVGKRLLREYGAVFVARGVVVPNIVVFKGAADVSAFQASARSSSETIGGIEIELQEPAMVGLRNAMADASPSGRTITPRGADAAKRTYADTVTLWASRVAPGLEHWQAVGRVAAVEAQRIRSLSPYEQVSEILRLEGQGLNFSKDFSKSIIHSVAPPGASQHLSMLALDVSEFDDPTVRKALAEHGWFQTVVSDLPHFTYLGVTESDLPELGLKKVERAGRVFWVPDL